VWEQHISAISCSPYILCNNTVSIVGLGLARHSLVHKVLARKNFLYVKKLKSSLKLITSLENPFCSFQLLQLLSISMLRNFQPTQKKGLLSRQSQKADELRHLSQWVSSSMFSTQHELYCTIYANHASILH